MKSISWKCRVVTIWKGWLPFVNLQMPSDLRVTQRYQDRVHLITVPGQNGVARGRSVGYQITAPNSDNHAVFVNADEKLVNLIWELPLPAPQRNAEVLADVNRTSRIASEERTWMDWKRLEIKRPYSYCSSSLSRRYMLSFAPTVEEKSEFDLSGLKQEQGQE